LPVVDATGFQNFPDEFSRQGRMTIMPCFSRVLSLPLAGMLLLSPLMPLSAAPRLTETTHPPALTEDQRILHVLNRLGYGPRPGDVERIRRLGLRQYIAQQLHPETIDDSAVEARLKRLPMLEVPTADLVRLEAEARQMRQEILRRQGGNLPENPGEALAKLPPEERRQMMERYREAFGDEKRNPRRMVSDLQQAKLLRAVYSERQLQEVMTDFWFNHFNVFAGKNLVRVFLSEYERDAIRPHALGRFEDLLRATAHSPAMLFYLDNWQSVTPDLKLPGRERRPLGGVRPGNGQPGQWPLGRGGFGRGRLGPGGIFNRGGMQRPFPPPAQAGSKPATPPNPGAAQRRQPGINENYARELLELHTLGVDGGYTQKDVQEVARCFTGWSIHQPFGGQRRDRFARPGMPGAADVPPGSFIYRDWAHDQGEKVVLGVKIPAGGGKRDGDMVLTLLARHPSTARFIATKLCRRFVADEPPAGLVARVAATFERTQGDIRACLQTIFESPEFFDPAVYQAKVKTPLEFVASTLRAAGAEITDAQVLTGALARMGMPLYGCQPPTGYKDVAEAWVNTGALLNRLNFALVLASGNLPGVKLPPTASGDDGRALIETLLARYVGGSVSETTYRALEDIVGDRTRLKVRTPTTPNNEPVLEEDGDAENDDASMMPAMPRPRRTPGKAFAPGVNPAMRRYDLALEALAQADTPLPLTAQLTGLILGSPEFQRR
jgi:uncharacterized protein (DUF1800 family)